MKRTAPSIIHTRISEISEKSPKAMPLLVTLTNLKPGNMVKNFGCSVANFFVSWSKIKTNTMANPISFHLFIKEGHDRF